MAVTAFAVGERARSFKAISPGLLPPLGIIFGLFVAFTATQVWTDTEKAKAEIDRHAPLPGRIASGAPAAVCRLWPTKFMCRSLNSCAQ